MQKPSNNTSDFVKETKGNFRVELRRKKLKSMFRRKR
jgi:hypothetical protein